jgi:hypothetical protein
MTVSRRFAATVAAMALAGFYAAAPGSAGGAGEDDRGVSEGAAMVTRQFEISGFQGVEISHAFEAEVRQGDAYGVTVEIDKAFEPHLQVRKAGSRLLVGLEPGLSLRFRSRRSRVQVTMPRLTEMSLSGSVNASVSGFRSGERLVLKLSGASSVEGDIDSGDVHVEASGASRVVLKGKAGGARIKASGASSVDFGDFATEATAVDLSGASSAVVRPAGKLDVAASGASRLVYIGSPPMGRTQLSGASTLSSR